MGYFRFESLDKNQVKDRALRVMTLKLPVLLWGMNQRCFQVLPRAAHFSGLHCWDPTKTECDVLGFVEKNSRMQQERIKASKVRNTAPKH